MEHRVLILFLAVVLLLFAGCKSGANFAVYNKCAYPAYASVDGGALVTIPAQQSHVFFIDTDTQNLFTGSVFRSVPVTLYGETYAMVLLDSPVTYTDSTTVKVQAGKTLSAYLNPNRASIKVRNDSSSDIECVEIWRNTSLSHNRISTLPQIAPGDSVFSRVDYAVPNNQFYYTVRVYLPGVSEYLEYGDASTILAKDQQYLVVYADPE